MTRTAPNRRVDNVAASLHHLAIHITRAVEHLMAVSGKGVYDTHDYNIMKRRKKDEFVLVDCFLE